MADYKGIYYRDNSKQRFFEGGAHFKYKQLYKILEKISASQKFRLKREQLIKNRKNKLKEKDKKKKQQPGLTSKNKDNNIKRVSDHIIIFNFKFLDNKKNNKSKL